jgi:hypothetical protein
MSESQPMEDTTTRCSRPPTLILWILWAVLSLNILSVSHLKPGLRYVGDITGFAKNMGTTISGMTAQYRKSVVVGFENRLSPGPRQP